MLPLILDHCLHMSDCVLCLVSADYYRTINHSCLLLAESLTFYRAFDTNRRDINIYKYLY